MANLLLKHIYKIYDNGTKAVSDFNLEIKDNEFVVFVGPSGCGKSTTLRMIAGLEDITAGDFFIDETLANSLEPKDRDMAMVFQNYALYPHMSVYDNMAFGLKIRHVNKEEIDKRVHQAAKILDIEDQLDKKPKAMSGGQRQRVALGRAIVRKPKVFLLDEPLSNLDAKLRSSMRSEITRLHNILKTTFIYVTHDQVEAMTMGTRIVVMKKGVIQQVDTPMNLYDYPSNLFVAGFIGTPQMNMVDAEFNYDGKDIIEINLGNMSLFTNKDELQKLDMLNVFKHEKIVLGIRPEHLKIVSKGERNAMAIKIINIESLGNDMNIEGYLEGSEKKIVVRTFRNSDIYVGDTLYVSFDFAKAHIFLKETEQTLLPRIPLKETVKGKVDSKGLTLLNKTIALPKALRDRLANGDYDCSIDISSIKKGNTFEADIISSDKCGDKYLYTLRINKEYLFYLTDEEIKDKTLKFDIDLKKIVFYQNNEVVLDSFKNYSLVEGTLAPVQKVIPVQTRRKDKDGNYKIVDKKRKVFDYQIDNHRIDVDWSIGSKIYALLGKQFALHSIEFKLPASEVKFSNEGIEGTIVDLLDFGDESYYKIQTQSNVIYALKGDETFNINDSIHLTISSEKIGVYDKNFEVELI